jgi:hypothetical protein
MHRTPPKDVRKALAQEVGFGCPVEGCGSPYLTWHHFDPPWKESQHHDVAGMVALCREHHDAADTGAYTQDDFREMKARGRDRTLALSGDFQWRRRRLLGVVGGSFYYETPILIQVGDRSVVAFNRDDQDRLLLNVAMPSTVSEPRLRIEDNFWIEVGEPKSVECPPSGRIVAVEYPHGDSIRVEFFEIADGEALSRRYRYSDGVREFLDEESDGYPVTAVEIRMRILNSDQQPVIDFSADATRVGGMTMVGALFVRGQVGLHLG